MEYLKDPLFNILNSRLIDSSNRASIPETLKPTYSFNTVYKTYKLVKMLQRYATVIDIKLSCFEDDYNDFKLTFEVSEDEGFNIDIGDEGNFNMWKRGGGSGDVAVNTDDKIPPLTSKTFQPKYIHGYLKDMNQLIEDYLKEYYEEIR